MAGDDEIAEDFIAAYAEYHPYILPRAQRFMMTLREYCPDLTRSQGAVSLLLYLFGRVDNDTYNKMSEPSQNLLVEWKQFSECWQRNVRTTVSPGLSRVLKLNDVIAFEAALAEPEDMTGDYYNLQNMLNLSDRNMAYAGETQAPVLDIVHDEYKAQLRERLDNIIRTIFPPSPPPSLPPPAP